MRKTYIYIALVAILIIPMSFKSSVFTESGSPKTPFFLISHKAWVDSTFNSMTNDERIAQLFMIAAYSNKGASYETKLANIVSKSKPGGIIFFQGTATRQAILTNRLQNLSKTPLLIGIDGECGLGSRLKDCIKYPKQMTLGAIEDNKLIYEMGREIGRQCKALGIHINFAPVADINSNPNNPVINTRSFGENKITVADKCIAYMNGMQDEGIIAVAKHFPGHGDTDTDSHKALPIINHNLEYLNNNELYTFKKLINKGVKGVMTAHISLPNIEPSGKAASLSYKIVNKLLKEELGFRGLRFTDALNMRAVCNKNSMSRVNAEALIADNDILLFPSDVEKAILAIKNAISKGEISQKVINDKCRKILRAKYYSGLARKESIYTLGINKELNTEYAKALNEKLIAKSITLIKNDNILIPLKHLENLKIASLAIGENKETVFQQKLSLYTKIEHYNNNSLRTLVKNLDKYNLIIINIYGKDTKYKSDFITKIAKKKKVILNYQRIPYKLKNYNLKKISAINLSYKRDSLHESYAAQSIFGGIKHSGILPVSISNTYKCGQSIKTNKTRLAYTNAELLGLNSSLLRDSIDSLATLGIKEKAYPGCQILIAKDGCVVFNKSYGHFTYDEKKKVNNNSIYDVASLTKITATLPAIMKLYENDAVKLNKKVAYYLPELKDSNKDKITLREVLLHQAGLKSYIFLFKRFIDETSIKGNLFHSRRTKKYNLKLAPSLYVNGHYSFKDSIFSKQRTPLYNIRMAKNMYMNINYVDTIHKYIKNSKIHTSGKYQYSDLGFIFLKDIIEKRTNVPFETYCNNNIYSKLGANHTSFTPLKFFSSSNIVPSCYDEAFRKDSLKGYVHDPIASMFGGVSGNSGLFANANDIAKIMSIYMNKGIYGDLKFIKNTTIKKFTSKKNSFNRRGLGFDKPDLKDKINSPSCYSSSAKSFGHSGFTGTLAWCDPKNNTIYVFLSNRTFPDDTNNKLIKMNVRTNIQELIYKSLDPIKHKSNL